MGEDPGQTVAEIEHTREQLAEKVDELVDRARLEAGDMGKKLALAAVVIAGFVALSVIAKRRVRS